MTDTPEALWSVDMLRAEIARLREAAKDASRLDVLDACWTQGVHVEVCATGSFSGAGLQRKATVFYGNDEYRRGNVRAAIDALAIALTEKAAK